MTVNLPRKIRTRFAPSPTGFIHLGNIRSALYPWAFARSTGGEFILRIEDTDQARSSQAAVDVILQAMDWLQLHYDAGPFYQTQRMERYKAVLQQLVEQGHAYPCYMSPEALDALRKRQLENKEKPRYDGTWRPEPGKTLPPLPANPQPVLRFRTPQNGTVQWLDQVKGLITIDNRELDDLIIARAAPAGTIGNPTYNFCVAVDDMDMGITHVIRGDDHVNNTPRQIHIFEALGYPVPTFAHLPTVLNAKGEKLAKRNGARAVTWYRDAGYHPAAMVNYLARLGWSHGDDEIFSVEQFLSWFNLDHLGKSATQFDETKLRWVNAQHLRALPVSQLCTAVTPYLQHSAPVHLAALVVLYRDRCETLVQLAEWLDRYSTHHSLAIDPAVREQYLNPNTLAALSSLAQQFQQLAEWNASAIIGAIQAALAERRWKMPQLAMPLRVAVFGTPSTPSVDAALALMPRELVIARITGC